MRKRKVQGHFHSYNVDYGMSTSWILTNLSIRPGKTHAGAVFSWRTTWCGKDPWWSTWWTPAYGKDSRWRSLWSTVSHGRDPPLAQGKRVSRKEQQEQYVMKWPQIPFPIPLCHLERGDREIGNEIEPGKKGEVGEGVLRIIFVSHHPNLI